MFETIGVNEAATLNKYIHSDTLTLASNLRWRVISCILTLNFSTPI